MIKFLVKGLLRDRQRSLFPVLIVAIGVWITVFFHAYINGVFGELVDSTARFFTGHVMVMSRAYAENKEQNPNDLALLSVSKIMDELRADYPEMTWCKRIRFGGLLDIPDQNGETRSQGPVAGLGVDLLSPGSSEIKTLNIEKALVRGQMPRRPGEILIGDTLAYKLNVRPGETATLLTSTMYGSMTLHNFIVAGTIRFGIQAMDRAVIIADIGDVQQALDMNDAAGEIVGFLEQGVYNNEKALAIVKRFNTKYNNSEDEFAPLMGTLREWSNLEEYLAMGENYASVLVLIFVLIMSVVLWNAGLLGGLRRYVEVGIRLAVGEQKGHIYRSMIYEAVYIGLVGSLLGTLLGLGCAWWLQTQGLDISSLIKNVNMMFPGVLRAKITATTLYIGFFPGLLSTVLGTALSGIGIYKRQTASLFKELEV